MHDSSPEEAEWLRDFEATQWSSAVGQETFGNYGHVSGKMRGLEISDGCRRARWFRWEPACF